MILGIVRADIPIIDARQHRNQVILSEDFEENSLSEACI